MSTTNWRERIVIDPDIHHGVLCIRGTRVPVSVLAGSIADGETINDLLASYPHLTAEDIQAALKFAAEAVNLFLLRVHFLQCAENVTPVEWSPPNHAAQWVWKDSPGCPGSELSLGS